MDLEVSSTTYKLILIVFVNFLISVTHEFGIIKDYSMVRFQNVGMGDSILIRLQKDRYILIDGGPDKSALYKINSKLPYSTKAIDSVIVSHSHADHITGLIYLIQDLKVNCIIYKSSDTPISRIEERLRFEIKRSNTNLYYDKYPKDCLSNELVKVYYPPDLTLPVESQNDESLLIIYSPNKNYNFIFTGDAEYNLQDYYLTNIMDCEMFISTKNILKVPHQGSKDSLNEKFNNCINPVDAIISVGKNSYGHPHSRVLDFYKLESIRTFRTDIMKDIEYIIR